MLDMDFMVFAQNSFLLAIIAIVCMYKYARTRDRGMIWLVAGLVVWPAIMMIMWIFVAPGMAEQIQMGEDVPFPFSLIAKGQITPGSCFVLLRDVIGSLLVVPGILRLYAAERTPRRRLAR